MPKTKKSGSNDVIVWTIGAIISVSVATYFIQRSLTTDIFAHQLSVRPTPQQMQEGDCFEINSASPGERLDLKMYASPTKYTIFDFNSEYCGPCQEIAPQLEQLTKIRPDIAVRSIDINRRGKEGIDWDSPICKQYNIHSIPHFKIFGPSGKLLVEGKPASEQIRTYIHEQME